MTNDDTPQRATYQCFGVFKIHTAKPVAHDIQGSRQDKYTYNQDERHGAPVCSSLL